MVLSVFGMWKASGTNEEEYNGFKFIPSQNGWDVTINNQKMVFNYLPKDIEMMNSTPISITGQKIYLAYDQEDKELDKSFTMNYLASLFYQNNIRPQFSCIKEKACPDNELPLVNCDDASAEVILIRSGNESKIFKQNMCYIIQSQNNYDLTVLRERFVYQFLGVMS